MVVEHLVAKANQTRDEGENLTHSVRYPFVKMSRGNALGMLSDIWGIGKGRETWEDVLTGLN
jgi:hypothetical protein